MNIYYVFWCVCVLVIGTLCTAVLLIVVRLVLLSLGFINLQPNNPQNNKNKKYTKKIRTQSHKKYCGTSNWVAIIPLKKWSTIIIIYYSFLSLFLSFPQWWFCLFVKVCGFVQSIHIILISMTTTHFSQASRTPYSFIFPSWCMISSMQGAPLSVLAKIFIAEVLIFDIRKQASSSRFFFLDGFHYSSLHGFPLLVCILCASNERQNSFYHFSPKALAP